MTEQQKGKDMFEQFRQWLVTKWQLFTVWVRNQSIWRLAFYGIGIPILLGIFLLGSLALSVKSGIFGDLPTYSDLKAVHNNQASEIYTEDGVLLGKYYIENRTDAKTDEITPLLVNALVATEDARFFEHSGIDLRAFGRVLVKSLLLRNESSGGGSTLSQQLAKNLYPRKSYSFLSMPINKLREMFIARRLEQLYDKEDLLRMYLNTVPFGENAFGIKVAAVRFFNKELEHLNVEEAALLIGMLKGTSLYNPRRNPSYALQRRNVVIGQLAKAGHLKGQNIDSLKRLPIKLDYQAEGHNEGMATYFREHLRHEVQAILKEFKKGDGSDYNMYTDGLKIYTSINSRMQRHAEGAVAYQMPFVQARFKEDWKNKNPWTDIGLKNVLRQTKRYKTMKKNGRSEKAILAAFDEKVNMTVFDWRGGAVDTLMSPMDSLKHYMTLLNVGVLSVEPSTALVRAWVGGIDNRFIQYDHVKSKRPVGSTFKPIVYTAALQSGMMPCEYTENQLRTYEEYDDWQPKNSDGKYGGAYSLGGALRNSVNTVAVELALRAGVKNVRQLAKKMGIKSHVPEVPAIALGAVEANLIDMVTAYSTFANRGYCPGRLHYLDRIETADGRVLVDFDRPNKDQFEKVLEPGHADMMLNIMQGVVDHGTAKRLRTEFGLKGALMGKTGTTQDQSDGWFVGYNPKMVTGVWVGTDHPGIHFRTLYRGQAARTALPVFGSYTLRVYKDSKFKGIKSATYPTPPEMVTALLECPPYLEEMPVIDTLNNDDNHHVDTPEEIAEWRKVVEAMHPAMIREIVQKYPRRKHERLGDYGERVWLHGQRIVRQTNRRNERGEKEVKRDERREERRKHWGRVLFGNKKNGG